MQRGPAATRLLNLAFESDEEDEEEVPRRPRWIKERCDDFESLDDRDFVTRYRLSKVTVMKILEEIEGSLEFDSDK